jgi:NTP pyrophosphatase (non-canonical NTP hydrolase)
MNTDDKFPTDVPRSEVEEARATAYQDAKESFIAAFSSLSYRAHQNSVNHGFWAVDNPDGVIHKLSRIALMHEELSECVHGLRKDLKDDHLPNRSMEVVELADTIIRIMDYANAYELPLAEVILQKMAYNEKRPFMHGDNKA